MVDSKVVVQRYVLKQAALQAFRETQSMKHAYTSRGASVVREQFTVEVFEAFTYPFMKMSMDNFTVKDVVKKVKDIWSAFQSAPNYWEQFKKMLGITATNLITFTAQLPKKIIEFFKQGYKGFTSVVKQMSDKLSEFMKVFNTISSKITPFNLVMEQATSYLKDSTIGKQVIGVLETGKKKAEDFLSNIKFKSGNTGLDLMKDIVNTFLDGSVSNTVGIPLKAYIFFDIWISVTELSWDYKGIIKGMLGLISWRELLDTLPESGVGYLVGKFLGFAFPGFAIFKGYSLLTKITGNRLMLVVPVFQVIYLLKNKLIEIGSSVIKFFWDKMGVPDFKDKGLPETISL